MPRADDFAPLLTGDDPLGVGTFAGHRIPFEGAPRGYDILQQKEDRACTVVLSP